MSDLHQKVMDRAARTAGFRVLAHDQIYTTPRREMSVTSQAREMLNIAAEPLDGPHII